MLCQIDTLHPALSLVLRRQSVQCTRDSSVRSGVRPPMQIDGLEFGRHQSMYFTLSHKALVVPSFITLTYPDRGTLSTLYLGVRLPNVRWNLQM